MRPSLALFICASLLFPQGMMRVQRRAGGGGGGITLIAPTGGGHCTGSGATSGSVSCACTGANFYVVQVASNTADTATVSDGGTDTFTRIVTHSDATSGGKSATWVAANVTGATRTFTVTATFMSFEVACFSNLTSSPAVGNSGTSDIISGGAAFACGSLAAGGTNNLILSGLLWSNTTIVSTVDSSFTIIDAVPFAGGVNYGGALAYKITSSTENPNYTDGAGSGSCDMSSWAH